MEHYLVLLLNLLDELREVLSLGCKILCMSQSVLLIELFQHCVCIQIVCQIACPWIAGISIACLFACDGQTIVHILCELILCSLCRVLGILCLDGQPCLLVVLFRQQFLVEEFLQGIQFNVTLHVVGLMEVIGPDL